MNKQKIKIFINPISVLNVPPVKIVDLDSVLALISTKFTIESMEVQLNEKKKPSELYFTMLSELCKTFSSKVKTINYVGDKVPNTLKMDTFDCMNLIIDNNLGYTLLYNNEKHSFPTIETLSEIISIL